MNEGTGKALPWRGTDGLVRMRVADLARIAPVHLVSGIDDHPRHGPHDDGVATSVSGYTEWVGGAMPEVSLGWDWCYEIHCAGFRICRVGPPRSNLLLIVPAPALDALAPQQAGDALAAWVDTIAWGPAVQRHILRRYRP